MIKWVWGKPLISSYSNEPQNGYIETTPDAGIPFRRQKFTDIMDLAQATFILDRNEYIDFMSWYKHDIRQGTIPFEIFDCRYGVERVARLIDKPTYQPNSKFWNVTVNIAFDSNIIEQERALIVNNEYLIVNDNDFLIVNKKVYL